MRIVNIYITFLTVIYSRQYLYNADFISTTTNGELNNSWRLNFTIFTNNVQGVVLYCFDSYKNQLGIFVTHGSIVGERSIRLTFNYAKKVMPTKELCGCTKCDNINMTFSLKLEHSTIKFTCNYLSEYSMKIWNDNDKNTDHILYPLPAEIIGTSRRVFLMMGNIGGYIGEGNSTVSAVKDQIIGCLHLFVYNDTQLTFNGSSVNMSSSCPCNNNPCNNGLCQYIDPVNYSCDCSFVEFNGRYCNRSLQMYDPRINTSYEMNHSTNQIYLKLTWKLLLNKVYCLMEIISEYDNVTIYINKNRLLINNRIISEEIIETGINCLRINIKNNELIIKIKNKEVKKDFRLYIKTRVNIGFSKKRNICEIYEGAYDLYFNSNELHRPTIIPDIPLFTTSNIVSIPIITKSNTAHIASKAENSNKFITIYSSIGLVACFVVFATVVIFLYRRSIRTMENLTPIYELSPGALSCDIQTETGIYGRVDDSHDYDYIQTYDDYGTVPE